MTEIELLKNQIACLFDRVAQLEIKAGLRGIEGYTGGVSNGWIGKIPSATRSSEAIEYGKYQEYLKQIGEK